MSETVDNSQYRIGGIAVVHGLLTDEQYEQSYFDHISTQPDMPFEVFLIYKNYLSTEQVNSLKGYLREEAEQEPEEVDQEAVSEGTFVAEGVRRATEAFFGGLDEEGDPVDSPEPAVEEDEQTEEGSDVEISEEKEDKKEMPAETISADFDMQGDTIVSSSATSDDVKGKESALEPVSGADPDKESPSSTPYALDAAINDSGVKTISDSDLAAISDPNLKTISDSDLAAIGDPNLKTISDSDLAAISDPNLKTISDSDITTPATGSGRTLRTMGESGVLPLSRTGLTMGKGEGASALEEYSKIDNYEILDEVARGGMGVIYKARQKDLNRIVAVKVMLSGAMASDQERKRFLREAEACAKMQHPNIIRVYEIGLFQDNYFFSMDFIKGMPLSDYVKEHEDELTDKKKIEIIMKVLDAIHYGHMNGIVHRDLKPPNIMINEFDEPIVMDFGLAKTLTSEDEEALSLLTAAGAVMGTPHYMAPEQAAGRIDEIDGRTDVFAMGVIVYELFTDKKPFSGNNVNEIFNEIFNIDPPSPINIKPKLDWEIEAIILKALEKEPEKRYQSALEMKEDFERYLDGEPVAAKKISRWYYIKKKIARHKLVFSLAALVAVLILGGIIYGGMTFITMKREAAIERGKEMDVIEEAGKRNEQLRGEILALVEQFSFNEARDKKREIQSGIEQVASVISNTKVGTKDSKNIQRMWELELEKLTEQVDKAEEESQYTFKVQECNNKVSEGNTFLAKAEEMLKQSKDNDKRSEGKRYILEAIRKYEIALNTIKNWEEARKGKFKSCVLMGVSSIEDKTFGLADSYLYSAKLEAKTDEEKTQVEELFKKYNYEKNEMQKYERYFSQGQESFSKKDYKTALAKFETAQQVFDTEEVRIEIKKGKFRIETEKAESFRSKGEFFTAVSSYRIALQFAIEDAEKSNTKQWIENMITKGIEKKLARIMQLIKKNRLDEAEKTVDEILALRKIDEIAALKDRIKNMKAVPPNMAYIDGGEFVKGTPEKAVGNPFGKVSIEAFYMSQYEVTNYQFKKFVDDRGYESKEYWSKEGWKRVTAKDKDKRLASTDGYLSPYFWLNGGYPQGDDDLPVCGISFYEACAYVAWLSAKHNRTYDLPTELRWEKAASWDNEHKKRVIYPWGDTWDVAKGNFSGEAKKIKSTETDRSPFNCYDMGGNLHEWVRSSHKGQDDVGILKGGAAKLPELLAKTMARASYKETPLYGFRGERVGFRVVTYPLTKEDRGPEPENRKQKAEDKGQKTGKKE